MHAVARSIIDVPPVGWDAIVESLSEHDLAEVAKDLNHLAQFVARAARYFDCRYNGDDHGAAVHEAQRTVTALREGLGFTYPKDNLTF